MQDLVKRNATYADLEAVPSHLVAEILNGELVTRPRQTGRHARVHARLLGLLVGSFEDGEEAHQGCGGWVFLTEPELHLGEDVAVPEIAGWRVERLPLPPEPDPFEPAKIKLVPDWVCEVLSQSTESYDRGDKGEIYACSGTGHMWLVDPRMEQLEAYERDAGRWRLLGIGPGDCAVRMPPFETAELLLRRGWPPRRRPGAGIA